MTTKQLSPEALDKLSKADLAEALMEIAMMKCDGDQWHSGDDDGDGEDVCNDDTHDQLVEALCIARGALGIAESGPIR